MMVKFLKFELYFMILGAVLCGGYAAISNYIPFGTWDYLFTTSGEPTQIIYEDHDYGDNLYVITADDLVYACMQYMAYNHTCALATADALPGRANANPCDPPNSQPPLAPENVVVLLALRDCSEEGGAVDLHFIGLADGRILYSSRWRGRLFTSVYDPFWFALGGAVIGFTTGLPIFAIWYLFRPRPKMKAKNDAKHASGG